MFCGCVVRVVQRVHVVGVVQDASVSVIGLSVVSVFLNVLKVKDATLPLDLLHGHQPSGDNNVVYNPNLETPYLRSRSPLLKSAVGPETTHPAGASRHMSERIL